MGELLSVLAVAIAVERVREDFLEFVITYLDVTLAVQCLINCLDFNSSLRILVNNLAFWILDIALFTADVPRYVHLLVPLPFFISLPILPHLPICCLSINSMYT